MDNDHDEELSSILARLAPGTVIRDGIERVIGAGRGALIVLGYNDDIEQMISGGFVIDTPATEQRIAELAKMDGALILDDAGARIVRANVHLVPESSITTSETGTRHRSAERAAKQANAPVISVSESMSRVTLYWGERRRVVEPVSNLLFRANQALSTLERYRARLDEVTNNLSTREVEDAVVLRDVILALQRSEMVRRIAQEIQYQIVELGTEGRLIKLQLDELMSSVEDERQLIVQDYLGDNRRSIDSVGDQLDGYTTDELLTADNVAAALAYDVEFIDRPVQPRGYRLLAQVPRLPSHIISRLVKTFGSLGAIIESSVDELVAVEGVGETRARRIRDSLHRRAEVTLVNHYE
ncbi:DNA integrity scanning diadenylate cyclase DisA [Salsipaludibacter albus]|uniref:DNA integrity scanning diadenylate cyclase DisA n=1 Tax=Salsipaludibacter albus TaxID=2849650 RepID=UPI001EE4D752